MAAPTLISTSPDETSGNPSVSLTLTKGQFVMAFLAEQSTASAAISDTNNLVNWSLLQSGTFNAGTNTAYVWIGTVQSSGNTTVKIANSGQSDFIVNVYSPSSIDVFSPIAVGTSGTAMQSGTINTNFAKELIVGWCAAHFGLSTSAPAGAPFTFDQTIPAITLNGTESDTVSSKGSFQSNFTGQTSGAWVSGVIGLVSPADATSSISGNAGIGGATVSYSGTASGQVTADGFGNFTISGLPNGSYTITPSYADYKFTPSFQNVTISSANVTGVNFFAAGRFTFIERASATPGATLYDVVDSGDGKTVGQLFFDPIVAQAWSFNLRDNQPYIAAGSADALDIEYFATSLAEPGGITIVQPGPTPSTRFAFTAIQLRAGQPVLKYLVSDGPSQAYGNIGSVVWDGVFNRWCFLLANSSSEISSPADVACLTTFVASLALISPNQISL